MIRVGVDLGGTKIEAIVLDEKGTERARRRIPTPRGDYAGTVAAVAELVGEVEAQVGDRAERIGIGIPGTISPATGMIKNANSTWLNGMPFDRDLAKALQRPVRLANDANCLTMSEATDGGGQGFGVVFGVILGTGVGGGIVVNGKILEGANRVAGEWGHNPLPWMTAEEFPGPACYCGRRGCIETFLSGPGLAAAYQRRGAQPGVAAEKITGEETVRRAHAGDVVAVACLDAYQEQLARALAGVINILDPDAIVLAGGLSNLDELYDGVPARWGRYIFSDRVETRLVKAKFGDSSGVRGAAWL